MEQDEVMVRDARMVARLMVAGLDGGRRPGACTSDLDWERIRRAAAFHGVGALCWNGLGETERRAMPAAVREAWARDADLTLYRQFAYDAEREAFLKDLARAGLSWLPLKGIVTVDYYPQPGLRGMGDQDLLVAFVRDGVADPSRSGEAERIIRRVMGARGAVCDADDARELAFTTPEGLHFEFHRGLVSGGERSIGLYGREILDYYADPWRLARPAAASSADASAEALRERDELSDATSRAAHGYAGAYRLRDEEEYLFHVTHMWKHCNMAGFGLRFLVETEVLRRTYADRVDWTTVQSRLERLGLADFERIVRELSSALFAHPDDWERHVGEAARVMFRDVARSGLYGTPATAVVKTVARHRAAMGESVAVFPGDGLDERSMDGVRAGASQKTVNMSDGGAGDGADSHVKKPYGGLSGRAYGRTVRSGNRLLLRYWMRRCFPDGEWVRHWYPRWAWFPANVTVVPLIRLRHMLRDRDAFKAEWDETKKMR